MAHACAHSRTRVSPERLCGAREAARGGGGGEEGAWTPVSGGGRGEGGTWGAARAAALVPWLNEGMCTEPRWVSTPARWRPAASALSPLPSPLATPPPRTNSHRVQLWSPPPPSASPCHAGSELCTASLVTSLSSAVVVPDTHTVTCHAARIPSLPRVPQLSLGGERTQAASRWGSEPCSARDVTTS
eukprot:2093332-Rhodomonas_salina.2